eukprot:CAMPEP_0172599470 /NCGR_PEP_ID=MMETSP1068-20121228/19567_1 /TAXON_ID=35684 /ORGANISM="Pseudopedinella elastica, Strain CCMP716" /LENGTH=37 /DNA_ID= /DNA_START= /DNA_END= /DNA_ORIENTATION=
MKVSANSASKPVPSGFGGLALLTLASATSASKPVPSG